MIGIRLPGVVLLVVGSLSGRLEGQALFVTPFLTPLFQVELSMNTFCET